MAEVNKHYIASQPEESTFEAAKVSGSLVPEVLHYEDPSVTAATHERRVRSLIARSGGALTRAELEHIAQLYMQTPNGPRLRKPTVVKQKNP